MKAVLPNKPLGQALDLTEPPIIIDRRGYPVDISGDRWELNEPTSKIVLDWSVMALRNLEIENAFKRYFGWLITAQSPVSVRNAFHFLPCFTQTAAFRAAEDTSSTIPYLAFSEARAALKKADHWKLHYARQVYRWCEAQGYPHFDFDVSCQLDDLVIGGNTKGQAVRSKNPNKGPLDAQEVASLTNALRAARLTNSIPLAEQALVWLALSTGSNAIQYACLREEDLQEEKLGDEVVAYILRIPRHKKGHVHHRAEFKERRLTRFVGELIADLVAQNRANYPDIESSPAARPILRSSSPSYGHNQPLAEWAWHLKASEVNKMLQRAVKQLGVLSRTGEPLHVTTRRFRYTLATRAVDSGASAYEVADALDHSDLQNVGVYFDVHSNIVEHLDQTMALALAPRAQAFAKLVENEASAIRGDARALEE